MQRQYWRRVRERARRETRSALALETRERVVIGAVVTIAAIALLWLFGSKGAPWDEAVAKVGPWIFMILAVYPVMWLWQFVRAPANLEREREEEQSRVLEALQLQIDGLMAERGSLPVPTIFFRRRGREWHMEINNHQRTAIFRAELDFSDADIVNRPLHTVCAWWLGSALETSRKIIDGGSASLFVHGISVDGAVYEERFMWINEYPDATNLGRGEGRQWTIATLPTRHRFRVILESIPPMEGGSRIIEVAVEGEALQVLSGSAQVLL